MNCYAIIPAAGQSRRMGRPKLLLPWPLPEDPGAVVIDCVLQTWSTSCRTRPVVVVRAEDQALIAACRRWPVDLVRLEQAPPDMKGSLLAGVTFLRTRYNPGLADWCFLAPADLPTLTSHVVRQMQDRALISDRNDRWIVPVYGKQSGHPVLMAWSCVPEMEALGRDEGVDSIVARSETIRMPFPATLRPVDMDTADAYRRLRDQSQID